MSYPTQGFDESNLSPGGASAAERVYAHLRRELFTGGLSGGMMISEGEVAAALGVSRTPVREALLRCEHEGHMRLYPKRGALVVPVTAAEIEDVFDLRRLIELHACERLASAPDLAAGLASSSREQATLLEAGRDFEFFAADEHFHTLMVSRCAGPMMTQAYGIARGRPLRIGASNLRADPGRPRRVLLEHNAIVEAVRAGDVAGAKAAVEAHLAASRTSLLKGLGNTA